MQRVFIVLVWHSALYHISVFFVALPRRGDVVDRAVFVCSYFWENIFLCVQVEGLLVSAGSPSE